MARNIHSDWCAGYTEAVDAYLRYSGEHGNDFLEIELLPHDDECWECEKDAEAQLRLLAEEEAA